MKSGLRNGPEGTHSVKSVLPIRKGLIEAVLGVPQPRQRRDVDVAPTAGASRARGRRERKHSDAVVLEVRRLREQEGAPTRAIVDILSAKGHAISWTDVHRYVEYQTAGALVPSPRAAPYV